MKNNQTAIYVANLGAYNAGRLVGKWLTLPMETEELESELEKIGKAYNFEGDYELAIHDYENQPYEISECTPIIKLNEDLQRLEALDVDFDVATAVIQDLGFDEGIELLENGDFIVWDGCDDMADVACRVVEEYYSDVLEKMGNLSYCFDYEAFGRNLETGGHFVGYDGGYVEVLR